MTFLVCEKIVYFFFGSIFFCLFCFCFQVAAKENMERPLPLATKKPEKRLSTSHLHRVKRSNSGFGRQKLKEKEKERDEVLTVDLEKLRGLLITNDYELCEWLLSKYTEANSTARTSPTQLRMWESFAFALDDCHELTPFFRKLVKSELKTDIATPLRTSSGVTSIFNIIMNTRPLIFLKRPLKKLAEKTCFEGKSTHSIVEEINQDLEKKALVIEALDAIFDGLQSHFPFQYKYLLRICLTEYQSARGVDDPQYMDDEKSLQWILCVAMLYFVTPSLVYPEKIMSKHTCRAVKKRLSILPRIIGIVLQKAASSSQFGNSHALSTFNEYISTNESRFRNLAHHLSLSALTTFQKEDSLESFFRDISFTTSSLNLNNSDLASSHAYLSLSNDFSFDASEGHSHEASTTSPIPTRPSFEMPQLACSVEGVVSPDSKSSASRFHLGKYSSSPNTVLSAHSSLEELKEGGEEKLSGERFLLSGQSETAASSFFPESLCKTISSEEEDVMPSPTNVRYSRPFTPPSSSGYASLTSSSGLQNETGNGFFLGMKFESEGEEEEEEEKKTGRKRNNSKRRSLMSPFSYEFQKERMRKKQGNGSSSSREKDEDTASTSLKDETEEEEGTKIFHSPEKKKERKLKKSLSFKKKEVSKVVERTKRKNYVGLGQLSDEFRREIERGREEEGKREEKNREKNERMKESEWCSRCSAKISNPRMCEECLSLFCGNCFKLPAFKNPCQNGVKHKFSLTTLSPSQENEEENEKSPIPNLLDLSWSRDMGEREKRAEEDCGRCSHETTAWKKCIKCEEIHCEKCQTVSVAKNPCCDGSGHEYEEMVVKEREEGREREEREEGFSRKLSAAPRKTLECGRCSQVTSCWKKCLDCNELFCEACVSVSMLKNPCVGGLKHKYSDINEKVKEEENERKKEKGGGGEEQISLLFFDEEYFAISGLSSVREREKEKLLSKDQLLSILEKLTELSEMLRPTTKEIKEL